MSNLKKMPGMVFSGTTRDCDVTAYWFVKMVSFVRSWSVGVEVDGSWGREARV